MGDSMKSLMVNALQINEKDDGMGKYAITIVEFLEKNYSNLIEVYYLTTVEGRNRLKTIVKDKDKLIEFNYSKKHSLIKKVIMENYQIPKIVKRYNIDNYWSLDGKLPLMNMDYCKKIITIQDVAYIDVPEHYSLQQRIYWNLIYKSKSKKAYLVIATSEFTKKRVINCLNVDQSKIKVVYNFVRDNFGKEESKVKDVDIQNYFLYYGQISPRKNIIGLIRAYLKYYNDTKNPKKLVLIGKKYEYFELDQLLKDEEVRKLLSNYIYFIDYVEDELLNNYILSARFVVNASFYEGFGLTVIESFEFGKPILASNNTAMKEFINQYEKYTFNPYDIDELVSKIKIFCNFDDIQIEEAFQEQSTIYKNKVSRSIILNSYKETIDAIIYNNQHN